METKLKPGQFGMSYLISRDMPDEYVSRVIAERKETLISRFLATAEPNRHYTFMFHEETIYNGPPLYETKYNVDLYIGEVEKVPVYLPELYLLPHQKMTARQLIAELLKRLWPRGKK